MIERCGDRQRKYDGLQKWPFYLIVESLPLMLQVSLFFFACGLSRYMASINTPVASVLVTLTLLGILFYLGIAIAGASSYECPFQTPVSAPLRSLWTKIMPCLRVLLKVPQVGRLFRFPGLDIRRRRPSPTIHEVPRSPISPDPQPTIPWFAPGELATIQRRNTIDTRCVSWFLRNITDPEALDTAIRLAGTILWFEDGTDVKPVYEMIITTFHACFGSDGEVYPGSKDRAYYSGRAILWIHSLALCESEESARVFALPTTNQEYTASDDDLSHLLSIHSSMLDGRPFTSQLRHCTENPSHLRWVSSVLLRLSWATLPVPDLDFRGLTFFMSIARDTPDAMHNGLLAYCSFLGSPVEEAVLKIQDKSCDLHLFLLSRCLCHCPLAIGWNKP